MAQAHLSSPLLAISLSQISSVCSVLHSRVDHHQLWNWTRASCSSSPSCSVRLRTKYNFDRSSTISTPPNNVFVFRSGFCSYAEDCLCYLCGQKKGEETARDPEKKTNVFHQTKFLHRDDFPRICGSVRDLFGANNQQFYYQHCRYTGGGRLGSARPVRGTTWWQPSFKNQTLSNCYLFG